MQFQGNKASEPIHQHTYSQPKCMYVNIKIHWCACAYVVHTNSFCRFFISFRCSTNWHIPLVYAHMHMHMAVL